jgi:hypothetical protein
MSRIEFIVAASFVATGVLCSGDSALAASVAASPLWGATEYNNNMCGTRPCSRLRVGFATQLDLCKDYDAFERDNYQWADTADRLDCVVANPQPKPDRCYWKCKHGMSSSSTITAYCGVYPGRDAIWDSAQGRYVCPTPPGLKRR